ncbi:GNAT family N-acetyltransferase [Microbacter margulisiae]|uniref:Acetyltransferase (GNAT) domain-containing protein n=1 Tax=Microbacter margulisiae TaxID=1350067 RepID=A0A7W5H0R1_9PORP|nr:GNAT family N-acetyltransferase [Microbacter margulisiae]MBB3185975.1 hypothetical protein [Microbacter margulisiae]
MYTITVIKSTDLTQTDWEDIVFGFNESFNLKKSVNEFKAYYTSSCLGYSYHAIARNNENRIIAQTTLFPYWYIVQGERMLFGLSGGTYVRKAYRTEAFLYVDMLNELMDECKKFDIKILYGVPNKNSFMLAVKFIGSKHVADLPYYVLPVSISNLAGKSLLKSIDIFYFPLLRFYLFLAKFVSSTKPIVSEYTKIKIEYSDNFEKQRFKKKNINCFRDSKENIGYYRIMEEKGLRTAYILDFRNNGSRTNKALTSLVNHIIQTDKPDIIMFIGTLNIKQYVFFKLPKKFEPQQLPLTYNLLDEKHTDLIHILSDSTNWDFGLLNFDAR